MDVRAPIAVARQDGSATAAQAPAVRPQVRSREDAMLLEAVGELGQMWTRTLCWQEAGRPATPPLSAAEVRGLQARARGEGPDGDALPPYLVEPYRAACLWYARVVGPVQDGRD